ncbi:MAG: CPBP family intramembrane metalloprotease [Peptococcaceae bacterium]|nr:CPBP family intramembrane metalloprotease [Peptococcaceae bacterium]
MFSKREHGDILFFLLSYKWTDLLGSILHGVVLEPAIEELYFRGVLQTTLAITHGIGVSVIVTTILFSLSHPPRKRWWALFVGASVSGVYAYTVVLSWQLCCMQ